MSKTYDVIIIGGGIGGLMAAYGLRSRDAKLRVAILEKGRPVEQRSCPASKGKGCVYCPVCSITSGFAGAGAFSDGKFNLGTAYGGTLGEELGETLAMTYIGAVSRVLDRFTPEGIEIKEYGSNEALKLKCLQNNLRLLDMNVKHLGTDNNLLIMQNLIQWLGENGVELVPNTEVTHVARSEDGYVLSTQREEYRAGKIIIATGRNGAEFVGSLCRQFEIPMHSNAVDIGVRVEMKDAIWREFSSQIYEPKILCRTKTFEDRTRCSALTRAASCRRKTTTTSSLPTATPSLTRPRRPKTATLPFCPPSASPSPSTTPPSTPRAFRRWQTSSARATSWCSALAI